jgi:DNA-binding transcriptional regulator GbsR (MarR family)
MQSQSEASTALALSPELSQFIESVGLYYESYGLPRIGGRMLGLFLVTCSPLSAEQIAEALKASRSSVSTNVRLLLSIGLVEKVSIPGDRCDYYRFSPSAWEQAIIARMQGIIKLKELAEQGLAALSANDPACQHLEGMLEWSDFVTEVYEKSLEEWRQGQAKRRSSQGLRQHPDL